MQRGHRARRRCPGEEAIEGGPGAEDPGRDGEGLGDGAGQAGAAEAFDGHDRLHRARAAAAEFVGDQQTGDPGLGELAVRGERGSVVAFVGPVAGQVDAARAVDDAVDGRREIGVEVGEEEVHGLSVPSG